MIRLARFLLLAGLVLLLGLNAAPVQLQSWLAEADGALAAGRIDEALDIFQQVAHHAEGRSVATQGIAQARLELAQQTGNHADYEQALEDWLACVPFQGWSIAVRKGLAQTYLGLGNTLAAAEQWEAVYAADPSDPWFWHRLASAHLQKGEWAAAQRAYHLLAALDPDNAEIQFWAGVLWLGIDPDRAQSHLLQVSGDPFFSPRAMDLLEALGAIKGLSDPARVAFHLGVAFLEVGELELAQEELDRCILRLPNFSDAWAYLSLVDDLSGGDGSAAVNQAVNLEPDSALAHSVMGHHWLHHGRPDLARPEFNTARQLDPDDTVHLVDIASSYQQEGDFYSAEAFYQAAIRQSPKDAWYWVVLAQFYLEMGADRIGEGLNAAQRAVALAPEDPAALDTLGWAQFLHGDVKLAEGNLLAARRDAPSKPAIYYHLGRVYKYQGRSEEARIAFQMALDLDTTCRACSEPRLGLVGQLAAGELFLQP